MILDLEAREQKFPAGRPLKGKNYETHERYKSKKLLVKHSLAYFSGANFNNWAKIKEFKHG